MLNSLRDQDHIYEGQRLRLAAVPAGGSVAPTPAAVASAARAVAESREETRAADVAEREAVQRGAGVGRAGGGAESDAGAGRDQRDRGRCLRLLRGGDDTIRVAAAETLGHYADWLGVPRRACASSMACAASTSVADRPAPASLDFAGCRTQQFEQRRREYHQRCRPSTLPRIASSAPRSICASRRFAVERDAARCAAAGLAAAAVQPRPGLRRSEARDADRPAAGRDARPDV